ncbi:MAG: V-type ATP synthase subunit F [Candidatus Paceibacterota bacterium]
MSNSDQNLVYKVAIIGPADTVSGFRALGVEAIIAHDASEMLDRLKEIKQATVTGGGVVYAVVCIIEDLLKGIDDKEYSRVVAGPLPAVVILPSAKGSQGLAEARLRQLAEKAVGAAII